MKKKCERRCGLRWGAMFGDGAVKESVSDAVACGGAVKGDVGVGAVEESVGDAVACGWGRWRAMLGDVAVKEIVGDAAVEAAVGRWCGEGKCERRCGLRWGGEGRC